MIQREIIDGYSDNEIEIERERERKREIEKEIVRESLFADRSAAR